MGGRSRFWAIFAVAATVLSVVCNLQNISKLETRIEKFRSISGTLTVPRGTSVSLDWRVEGWGAKVWLNGQRVATDEVQMFSATEDTAYTLEAKGLFGEDARTLKVIVSKDGQAAEESAKPGKAGDSPAINPAPADGEMQSSSGNDQAGQTVSAVPGQPPAIAASPSSSDGNPASYSKATLTPTTNQNGYLTIRSSIRDVTIGIRGIGTFSNEVSNLPCPPSSYEITASRPYFATLVNSVTVDAGQHAHLDLVLTLDQARIQRDLNDAAQQAYGHDPMRAAKIVGDILAADPANLAARSIRTLAYFRANNMQAFSDSALDALHRGAIVYMLVAHRGDDKLSPLHQVLIVIENKSISFKRDTDEVSSDLPRTALPLQPGDTADVVRDSRGQIYLSLKLRDTNSSGHLREAHLWELGTRIERAQVKHGLFSNTEDVAVSPADAQRVLGAIATILQTAIAKSK